MTDFSGKTLGQYQLKEIIGKGGMAVVYRAHQSSMKRDVAIKVMASELGRDPDFVGRFTREAELFAVLQHPHILPVIDFGSEGSTVFIVMRLVEGGSLDDRIKHGGNVELPLAARMLEQIGSALSFAHDKGIVHRDLKPNNVLLDAQSNTYLTDFGIAKMLAGTTKLTATNAVLGTPAYMAPEQWRGENIDARTDIYSLGIMAYEIVTGRLPFQADTSFTLMYKHFNDLPPEEHMEHLPPIVKAVILKALAKNPEDRFVSAHEFGQTFRSAVEGRPVNLISTANNQTIIDDDRTMIGSVETGFQTSQTGRRTSATNQYGSQPNISAVRGTSAQTMAEPGRGGNGLLIGGFGLLAVLAIAAGIFFFVLNKDDGAEVVENDTASPTTQSVDPTNTNTPEATEVAISEEPIATVLTQRSVVYAEPGQQFAQVFVLPRGTEAEVIARTPESDWYKVEVAGEVGWVAADTISLSGNMGDIGIEEKPTEIPTETPTPTASLTPTEMPSATPTASLTPRPTNTWTNTPNIPVPFTPTPSFTPGGEVAVVTNLSPEEERERALLLPLRSREIAVDDFEGSVHNWIGGPVENGALVIQSQGEIAGAAEVVGAPHLRDFYLDVTFTGDSEENYTFAVWFRTQADQSGYVIAINDTGLLQVGYLPSGSSYDAIAEISSVDVDFSEQNNLSVVVISNFLEIYINGELIGSFVIDSSSVAGSLAMGVYTVATDAPPATILVNHAAVYELQLQPPLDTDPDNDLYLGEISATTTIALEPEGAVTTQSLERGQLVWVLGKGQTNWVFVYSERTFGWIQADTVDIRLDTISIIAEILPPLETSGFPVSDASQLMDTLSVGDIAARVLQVNTPIEDELATNETHQWHFTAEAGKVYIITMEQIGFGVDPYLIVKDAAGNVLAENDDTGNTLNATVRLEMQMATDITIEARSVQTSDTGSYQILVQDEGGISTRLLEIGTPQTDTLNPTDVHIWQFEAEAGQTYVITMDNASGNIDPYITLKDANGNIVGSNDDKAGSYNSLLTFTADASGLYSIEAGSVSPDQSGDYVIQVALEE